MPDLDEISSRAWRYTHPYPYALGERCRAGHDVPATHKVEEATEDNRHPFTTYLCCSHFGLIMGKAAQRVCEMSAL